MKPFLVDNKELGREFRSLFLTRLAKLIAQGKIAIEDTGYIADLIGDLSQRDWVAFIEGPPKPDCPPSQMLKYLTRYLTGGPISDRRIIGEKDGRIYFSARSKHKGGGVVEASLSNVEFVRQWSLHILPKEFTKTRHYGSWSGSQRRTYMELCGQLAPPLEILGSKSQATDRKSSTAIDSSKTDEKHPSKHRCPHCQGELNCIVREERPAWRELFYGPAHPAWFEWTSLGKCSPPDEPIALELENELAVMDSSDLERDIFDEMIACRRE
jgi:hypothetical protein